MLLWAAKPLKCGIMRLKPHDPDSAVMRFDAFRALA